MALEVLLLDATTGRCEQDCLRRRGRRCWSFHLQPIGVHPVMVNLALIEPIDAHKRTCATNVEQQALHYELHKNIALQRRVTLSQAENIRTLKDENAELAKQLADAQGASSSLATASTELENLRSSYQELETKLKEAELKREQAEKQLAEKNSEHIREKGELELKKNADSETIRRQQKELNGLRKFMETAEQHWDLLNENILEPLGYPEQRRNLFPRDDLLQLAGDDCKDLISASRKICHNLNIKRSRTCDVRKLIGKMDVLPELVIDLQASSARGAAAMALTMCLAHTPGLDLDEVTTGVPPDADVGELLDAVSGYDTRIARRIRVDDITAPARPFFSISREDTNRSETLPKFSVPRRRRRPRTHAARAVVDRAAASSAPVPAVRPPLAAAAPARLFLLRAFAYDAAASASWS
ncbi:uncharacterized protein [Lolium perenne]|uniref:uncharacterized protein n=1 Tax=Lolium perenne TaxID=4522 RepID=UPI003A9987B4